MQATEINVALCCGCSEWLQTEDLHAITILHLNKHLISSDLIKDQTTWFSLLRL